LYQGMAGDHAFTIKPHLSPSAEAYRCRTKRVFRFISGYGRSLAAWMKTLEIAEAVRANVVLFQCPASFRPSRANIQNLSRFFQKIGSQSFRLAWEPLGPWPAEVVRELCVQNRLIHCVDPLASAPNCESAQYWRLHGKGSYSYRYTDEDLVALKKLLLSRTNGTAGRILFNNVTVKEDASRFRRLLGNTPSSGYIRPESVAER
jgi:uncharacterized protein YecE (DUF72 family)